MRKIVTSLIAMFLFIFTVNVNSLNAQESFEKLWNKVSKYEQKGLPQSALSVVDSIYNIANETENNEQLLKSIIYRTKLSNYYNEDQLQKLIGDLSNDAETYTGELKAMTHLLSAKIYIMFYQINYWNINQRTNTGDFSETDIKTWTTENFNKAIINEYRFALENPKMLLDVPISNYSELISQDKYSLKIQPTLLDFIVHDAVKSLTSTRSYSGIPQTEYVEGANLFSDSRMFIHQDFNFRENNKTGVAIDFLKILMRYRQKEDIVYSRVYTDLERLSLAKKISSESNASQLYFDALFALHEKYKNDPAIAEIDFALAEWYQEKGNAEPKIPGDTLKSFWLTKADQICINLIKDYPNTNPAQKAQLIQNSIRSKYLSFTMENFIVDNTASPILIEYKNIDSVFVSLYRIEPEKYKNIIRKNYGEKRLKILRKEADFISVEHIDLPKAPDYVLHSTEYISGKNKNGFYILFLSSKNLDDVNNNVVYKTFTSTSMAWISESFNLDNKVRLFVTDRKDGKPLNDIDVTVYDENYDYKVGRYVHRERDSGSTDSEGVFTYKMKDNYVNLSFKLNRGEETLYTSSEYYNTYRYNSYDDKPYYNVNFFTDRAVYRPGQTMHVKGICTVSQNKNHEILKNYTTTVFLYDVNYQEIAQKLVKTNDFGSFVVDFEIPEGLLNGNLQLRTESSSKYVRLEEYKRPAFEVDFLDFDGNYRLNKKVTLKGKASAYTGAKISDASVKYRVYRQARFENAWRYYYMPINREMLSHGEITTNQQGEFEITFKAEPMIGYPVIQDISFNYSIEAEVTDITGETQSAKDNITIGYRSLLINTNLNSEVNINSLDSIVITTQNLNYKAVNASGTLVFSRLSEPDYIVKERLWSKPEFYMFSEEEWNNRLPSYEYKDESKIQNYPVEAEVCRLKFNTKSTNKFAFNEKEKLTSGAYKIEIYSEDSFGIPVIEKEYIRITSDAEKKVNKSLPLILKADNEIYNPGDDISLKVGSGFSNASIRLCVMHEDKMLLNKWIKPKGKIQKITIPIDESLRGGIVVNTWFVLGGTYYEKTINLTVPFNNKKLDIKFVHFRDEVLPGAEEQIIMTINGFNKEFVAAEMLANMYDASLDAFYPNNYSFSLYYPSFPEIRYSQSSFSNNRSANLVYSQAGKSEIVKGQIPSLNLFGLNPYGNRFYSLDTGGNMRKEGRSMAMTASFSNSEQIELSEEEVTIQDQTGANASGEIYEKQDITTKDFASADKSAERGKSGIENVQMRSNFNETAFFYPQLRTNEKGEISFVFTAPESLTRWKFMALAHTQDLRSGVVENEMITRKQLMVVPNMPRFLREGDNINLNIKISSLTESDMSGYCELHFINVLNGKDITSEIVENKNNKEFSVGAHDNTSVNYKLHIPMGLQAVEYRVIAKTEQYGDGEQRVIPVLSNRTLVTESMPMYVNGKSTKTWRFKKLINSNSSSTLKHHQLSLEMTPRPAWYAVQALPYLMEYPYECSEQVFSRYYANSIAAYIANSDPAIRSIFDAWKNIPESNALMSNLQKNEDLKSVMLQQTPWVLQAKDESERKRRVGVLFDVHRMSKEQNSTLLKLKKKQVSSGAWPWFEGMPESRYITQHIVAGLGHLKHLGVVDIKQKNDVDAMMRNACNYLDNQLLRDYNDLLKNHDKEELKDNHLSYLQIHYLYTRSFTTDIKAIDPNIADAYKYFYAQAKKYWVEFNSYSKGMIALTMYRTESISTANDIIASLKEYAITSDEMGMYWKNTNGWYWYQAPIETQALLIEAFDEIANDKESVERMKQWLLNQKRTQDWKTTKATAEAVYALILTGQNLLDLDENVIVEIGGKIYDPEKDSDNNSEAGTGYFRKNWNGSEVLPEMGEVKLTKSGEGMAWGALHWQYFEDMDNITSHETPLKLEKKLFRRIDSDNGVELQLLDNNHKLVVGDQLVVRVILRSDRNMEYVHMKDMRASCLEPVSTRSGYHYQDGLGYYQSVRDASVDFFFTYLRKGTYVFEYPLYVTHTGDFSNGITNIQCMYAPEYNSHSEGARITVE